MHPGCLMPGSRAIIRDNVYNYQNGIPNAESYRGRVMTIDDIITGDGETPAIIFKEDQCKYIWDVDQVELYFEGDSSAVIDSSSMNSLLEAL